MPPRSTKRTIVGDVLDDAVDDLTSARLWIRPERCSARGLFQDRATRHDDVAALAVHLQDLERLRDVHQRG